MLFEGVERAVGNGYWSATSLVAGRQATVARDGRPDHPGTAACAGRHRAQRLRCDSAAAVRPRIRSRLCARSRPESRSNRSRLFRAVRAAGGRARRCTHYACAGARRLPCGVFPSHPDRYAGDRDCVDWRRDCWCAPQSNRRETRASWARAEAQLRLSHRAMLEHVPWKRRRHRARRDATPARAITVVIEANAPCWVTARTDGHRALYQMLNRARGQRSARIERSTCSRGTRRR